MNYLAHHALARRLSTNGAPLFFAGNILPDLLALYGVAKVRQVHLPPADDAESPLLTGMRLHFTTDVRFHSLPAFTEACATASTRLKDAPFPAPLRRVFFLAHILVEIALDGHLLQEEPTLADDLYSRLSTIAPADANGVLRSLSSSVPDLASVDIGPLLERFVKEGWLGTYATFPMQAEALYRICRRGDVPAFQTTDDRQILTAVMEAFAPDIATFAPRLLLP